MAAESSRRRSSAAASSQSHSRGTAKDSPQCRLRRRVSRPRLRWPDGNGRFNGRFGGRGAQGKITAVKGSTLTLDRTDFSGATITVIVTTTADTKLTETVAGSVSDIAVGDNVLVVGTASSGAVTATDLVDNGEQTLGFRGRTDGRPRLLGRIRQRHRRHRGRMMTQGGPGFSGPGGRGGFTARRVTDVSGATITIKTVAGDGHSDHDGRRRSR